MGKETLDIDCKLSLLLKYKLHGLLYFLHWSLGTPKCEVDFSAYFTELLRYRRLRYAPMPELSRPPTPAASDALNLRLTVQ